MISASNVIITVLIKAGIREAFSEVYVRENNDGLI